MPRFSLRCAVYLILQNEGKVLLMRRAKTGFKDGEYSLPSGHLDGGEKATDAIIREAKEEIGVVLSPQEVALVYSSHRRSGEYEYIDLLFQADNWHGHPQNLEPEFCDDLSWFDPDKLPENTVDYIATALQRFKEGKIFSEFDF